MLRSVAVTRRKSHRKAKRKAERLRRKALAAAGLKEEDINGSANEAAFREKLTELEEQYRVKHGGDKGRNGRTKVKGWKNGLRRRKGKGKGRDKEEVEDDGEDANSIDGVDGVNEASTGIEVARGDTRGEGAVETSSILERAVSRTPTPPDVGPTDPMITDSAQSSTADETGARVGQISTADAGPVSAAPYFPPAYRPASVRSYQINDSGPSRPPLDTVPSNRPSTPPPSGEDKTRAPGYYPAPTTEASENALAVASRSDGKARMHVPEWEEVNRDRSAEGEEGEPGMRHVATDDKRVLERLRLGGSAPPASIPGPSVEEGGEGGEGPSAPGVEVDEDGFERPVDFALEPPVELPETDQRESRGGGAGSAIGEEVVGLPAPPKAIKNRSFRRTADDEETHEQLSELQLLPSAPPSHDPTALAPSAPPGLEEEEVHEGIVASAPPLLDDDDIDTVVSELSGRADGEHSGGRNENSHEQNGLVEEGGLRRRRSTSSDEDEVVGHTLATDGEAGEARAEGRTVPTFLPRYEP